MSTILKPFQRYEWILAYLKKHRLVDVLNSDFVDEYVKATGATYVAVAFGAHRCRMLGNDLSSMAKCGALKRYRVGVHGHERGFPKWVWGYEVGHAAYLFEQRKEQNA